MALRAMPVMLLEHVEYFIIYTKPALRAVECFFWGTFDYFIILLSQLKDCGMLFLVLLSISSFY